MECERCYHCDTLAEEDFMTSVSNSDGFFQFCSEECYKLWEDEERRKSVKFQEKKE